MSKLSVIFLLPVFQNKYYCLDWSTFILHLAPCTYPVVMVTVGAARTYQPFPSIGFCFQLLLARASQHFNPVHSEIILPMTLLLSAPSSLSWHWFLVKLSWQALMILIHAQTTSTCVSIPWLRYHYHGAQWLTWFCLWLHRWWCGLCMRGQAACFLKLLISVTCNFFRMSAVNVQVSQASNSTDITRERISLSFELREVCLLFQMVFSLPSAAVVCAILDSTSGMEPWSDLWRLRQDTWSCQPCPIFLLSTVD